jgi:hypothetical protein
VKLLAIAWVVAMPYAFAASVSGSARVRAFLGRHYVPMVTAGWAGVVLLVVGGFALSGAPRAAALAVGAPLAGLSFWSRAGGDDGDGGRDEPDDGGGDGDVDWDRFMRELDRWAASRQPVHR